MLVCADDGGIEHEIFEVRTITQRIEDKIPYAFLGPSSETLEHSVPIAEVIGQIAPRCSSPCDPQIGIDEQAIVLAVPPLVTFVTRTIPLNPRPLRVRQFPPNLEVSARSRAPSRPLALPVNATLQKPD
jgi:hypothetical protein